MRLAVLALALACAAPASAQLTIPAPASLVRAGVMEKLTEYVWAIPDGSASLVPNVGIVRGDTALLIIDTGMGERNGATVLKEALTTGLPVPIYIVSTHFHPEHDLGAQAFPADAKMIRSKDEQADIDEFGMQLADMFASRSELNKELLAGARYRKADIVFDQSYELDLGGVKATIMAMGPNHTRGDTVVLVDGVLFSGDVAMRGQPSFASPYSSLSHWLESLDKLAALKPKIVVPSHGRRGDAKIIAGYQSYLTKIRDRTAALKKSGKSLEEAVATVTKEMSGEFPDTGRLGGAIKVAYAEAK